MLNNSNICFDFCTYISYMLIKLIIGLIFDLILSAISFGNLIALYKRFSRGCSCLVLISQLSQLKQC